MKSNIKKLIEAIEDAGFNVDRIVEEDNRDAGSVNCTHQNEKTGAFLIKVTPAKEKDKTPDLIRNVEQLNRS